MRQDHDRTVREARDNMAGFDRRKDLERWLQNYVHPELGVPSVYWCACTKHEKRWKIEYGLLSGTEPVAWCWADPGAPEPPILEFRRPKPEPVKPRFRGDEPFKALPSLDTLMADMNAKIMEAFFIPLGTLTNTIGTVPTGFTIEKFRAAMRDLPPAPRVPLWEPFDFKVSYDPAEAMPFRTSWVSAAIGSIAMSPHCIIGIDMGGGPDRTVVTEFTAPAPPAPSKRNQ